MRWEKASNENGEEGNGTISFGSRKGNIGGGDKMGKSTKTKDICQCHKGTCYFINSLTRQISKQKCLSAA